jgi:hypothetical protein
MKQKHKPIKQAFTTYDRPKTLSFAVVVMERQDSPFCQFTDRCKRETSSICPICALSLCSKHTGKETMRVYPSQNSTFSCELPLCPRCQRLPHHVRRQVLSFRERLKGGME